MSRFPHHSEVFVAPSQADLAKLKESFENTPTFTQKFIYAWALARYDDADNMDIAEALFNELVSDDSTQWRHNLDMGYYLAAISYKRKKYVVSVVFVHGAYLLPPK